jgi:phage shock protein PspC (stress-responsive transcriptional regulator)
MKKTVNVNISGQAFVIDENAYALLESYLQNLRNYFRKEEGVEEIVADFEARIGELLSERVRLGAQVINQEHIEDVIARVGKPDDFSEGEASEEDARQQTSETGETKRKLFRNPDDKMLGGVFSGLGAYFGIDVTLMRIIGVVLLFVTQGVLSTVYLIAWIAIPQAKTASEKLQMEGKPLTVENIGKAVSQEAGQVIERNRGVIDIILQAFVVILKIFAVGLGILLGLPFLIVLFLVIILLFAIIFGVGGGLLSLLPFGLGEGLSMITVHHPALATVALLIMVGLPVALLIYAIVAHFARFKPLDTTVKWILLGVWILSFILLFFSGFTVKESGDRHYRGGGKKIWLLPFISVTTDSWEATIKSDGDDDSEYEYADDVSRTELEYILVPFDRIKMENMSANLKIVQVADSVASKLLIEGQSRHVHRLSYKITDGRLVVSGFPKKYASESSLRIIIQTHDLKELKYDGIGEVALPRAITGDELIIEQNSIGKFEADSLNIKRLTVRVNGMGAVYLAGQTSYCHLEKKGLGALNADELIADTVKARVDGIGTLDCYPVNYLDAKVEGIGKITYHNSPSTRKEVMLGLGKIEEQH